MCGTVAIFDDNKPTAVLLSCSFDCACNHLQPSTCPSAVCCVTGEQFRWALHCCNRLRLLLLEGHSTVKLTNGRTPPNVSICRARCSGGSQMRGVCNIDRFVAGTCIVRLQLCSIAHPDQPALCVGLQTSLGASELHLMTRRSCCLLLDHCKTPCVQIYQCICACLYVIQPSSVCG